MNGLIELIVNDFVAAEELVVELSNIQKIIQILNSNEAKTWVHNNDADTGPAGSLLGSSYVGDWTYLYLVPISFLLASGIAGEICMY